MARARRAQVSTGAQGLVGEHGVARSALQPAGKVFVHGEIWSAVAEGEAAAGDPIEVLAVDGLTLRVRPLRAAASGHAQGGLQMLAQSFSCTRSSC